MRAVFLWTVLIVALVGGAIYGGYRLSDAFEPQPIQSIRDAETALQDGSYVVLPNGTLVYESNRKVTDIEPAAGQPATTSGPNASFRYDPVTQTYRRVGADGRQEIITNNR